MEPSSLYLLACGNQNNLTAVGTKQTWNDGNICSERASLICGDYAPRFFLREQQQYIVQWLMPMQKRWMEGGRERERETELVRLNVMTENRLQTKAHISTDVQDVLGKRVDDD